MPVEQFIIEIVTDTTELEKGQGRISDVLKKVNADIAKSQQELGREANIMSKLTSSISKLHGESKRAVESLLKMGSKEIVRGFDELGLSIDDYIKSLTQVNLKTDTFTLSVEDNTHALRDAGKAEDDLGKKRKKTADETKKGSTLLKEYKEELRRMADAGEENTQKFEDLSVAAAQLEDSIGNVSTRIRGLASNTRVFDGLLSAAQGVAGGFAVAQGAMALFGEEGSELQETLLKVNSAMAILQGLQTIQQVLNKNSAASLLFLNNAQKTNAVVTALATGAESKNIIVKTASAVASRALATAMALSNPITLAVVAVITALTAAYKFFTKESKEAAAAQVLLNQQLQATQDLAEELDSETMRFGERRLADMKAQGATEKQLREQELKNLFELRKDASKRELAFDAEYNKAVEQRRKSTNADEIERLDKTIELYKGFQNKRVELDQQVYLKVRANAEADKQETEQRTKEAEEKRKADYEKRLALDEEFRQKQREKQREALAEELAGYKAAQFGLKENTEEWKDLQEEILRTQSALDNFDTKGANARILAEKELQAELLRLRAGVTPDSQTDEVKGAIDIETQFREQAAKEQVAIDKDKSQKLLDNISFVEEGYRKAARDREEIKKEEDEKDKERNRQRIIGAIDTTAQIVNIFAEALRQQSDRELERISEQKENIKELEEAGAITAKQAERRMNELDQKEKTIKIRAAQRDKQIAIFQAIIATAAAVAKALPVIPLAIIAGALGAAQIALIAARPIPKFARGKAKGVYEGPGIVGEAGAELIERNGRMMVATKPALVMLNKQDKVYTARETAKMLASIPSMGKAPARDQVPANGLKIDYDKMGKIIAKNIPQVGLSVDEFGFKTWVRDGIDKTTYLDKRRKF
jgi:hypothetical protein